MAIRVVQHTEPTKEALIIQEFCAKCLGKLVCVLFPYTLTHTLMISHVKAKSIELQEVCYRKENIFAIVPNRGPPLWPNDQSSWLQIRRSGFDSRHYQKKEKVVGLERGPLSLVSTTEELLDRKVAAPV
jgi:hypothetical protein